MTKTLVRHRHTTPRPPPRDPCAPYDTHGHEPLIDSEPGRTIARIRHRCDGLPDTGVANRVEEPWPTLVRVSPSEKPVAETRTGPRGAHAFPLALAAEGHRASPSRVERAMRRRGLPQPARLPARTLAAQRKFVRRREPHRPRVATVAALPDLPSWRPPAGGSGASPGWPTGVRPHRAIDFPRLVGILGRW